MLKTVLFFAKETLNLENYEKVKHGIQRKCCLLRKSQYGRKGWKVMPAAPPPSDTENLNNLMNLDMAVIERVMARIREIELSGHVVPEMMTVKV